MYPPKNLLSISTKLFVESSLLTFVSWRRCGRLEGKTNNYQDHDLTESQLVDYGKKVMNWSAIFNIIFIPNELYYTMIIFIQILFLSLLLFLLTRRIQTSKCYHEQTLLRNEIRKHQIIWNKQLHQQLIMCLFFVFSFEETCLIYSNLCLLLWKKK